VSLPLWESLSERCHASVAKSEQAPPPLMEVPFLIGFCLAGLVGYAIGRYRP